MSTYKFIKVIKKIVNENAGREAGLNVRMDSFSQREMLMLPVPHPKAVVIVYFLSASLPQLLIFILFLLCLDMYMFLVL